MSHVYGKEHVTKLILVCRNFANAPNTAGTCLDGLQPAADDYYDVDNDRGGLKAGRDWI
jgi:hypothetical protein